MSRKKRKNINLGTQTAEADNAAAVAENSSPHEEAFEDGEQHKHHELFKFDWELEENILEALDEDASELTDENEPSQEPEPPQVRSLSLAQAAQAFFGLFILVFSIIGVVATGVKIARIIEESKDNTAQLEYFEDFVKPLVATDTPIFDGAASLNEDVIITCACWDIIFNPSIYFEYSNGVYKVSHIDVDKRIAKLFGSGLSYTHKTVGDTELTFDYNEETGMYSIPAYPRSPAYYPEVSAITAVENGLELTVKYRLPITNWIESLNTVEKTMIYTVAANDNDYRITAVRIGEISGPDGEL